MTLADTKRFATNLLAACEMIESVGMPEPRVHECIGFKEDLWSLQFVWELDDSQLCIVVGYSEICVGLQWWSEAKDDYIEHTDDLGEETRAALVRAKAMMEGGE